MENLVNRNSYPDGMALRIETMGSITVSIANRWMMGWPNLVKGEPPRDLWRLLNLREWSHEEIQQVFP
jgi:hypothetical protein